MESHLGAASRMSESTNRMISGDVSYQKKRQQVLGQAMAIRGDRRKAIRLSFCMAIHYSYIWRQYYSARAGACRCIAPDLIGMEIRELPR